MLTQAVFLFLSGKTKLGCSHDAAKYALARSGDHTPRCGPTHVFGHFLFYISTDLCQIIAFLNRPSRTCHRNRGHNHTGHPSHNRSHNDRPSHGHTYRPSRHHSNRSDWPADCGSWGRAVY